MTIPLYQDPTNPNLFSETPYREGQEPAASLEKSEPAETQS